MTRNREFNAHLMKYVSACVRQGVSKDSIRGALQMLGGMSEASVEIFLSTQIKEFALAGGSGEINLGGFVVLDNDDDEGNAETPEIDFQLSEEPAGLMPPLEEEPSSEREASIRPVRSPLEIILENQRQIEEITQSGAAIQLERAEHRRPARVRETNPMPAPRKRRKSGRWARMLRNEAIALLHSLYLYCLLFLLGGLVAIHLLDRLDPMTLSGMHLAQSSALVHIDGR